VFEIGFAEVINLGLEVCLLVVATDTGVGDFRFFGLLLCVGFSEEFVQVLKRV
jgi:hypothetical protein